MKKSMIAVAVVTALVMGTANATGNRGSNHHNTYNNATGIGLGGQGGHGGHASASAGAVAGASAKNTTVVGVGVRNSSSNVNVNKAYGGNAHQGQLQGQLQGQVQGQDNDQNMTYNETNSMRYSGSYSLKTNPSMALGGISPTAPCAIPVEGSYSGVGIGVGIGTAYVDKGCERRELIRMGLQSGNEEATAKAATLLNRDLDEALGDDSSESGQPVASGASADDNVWAFQNL